MMIRPRWYALLLLCTACTVRPPLPPPRSPLSVTPGEALADPPAIPAPSVSSHLLPKVEVIRLENGFTVYVVERHEFAHVALSFVNLRSGEDPKELEQAGLSSLVNEVVIASADESEQEQGKTETKTKTKTDSAPPEPESVPSFLRFRSVTSRHTATFSTSCESSEAADAIATLAEMVRAPRLEPTVLDVAKERVRASWDGERYDPRGLSRSYVLQRIYGPNHVLGQHSEWAVKHVDDIDLEQVKAGYSARYVPSASALLVVGDVDTNAVREVAQAEFGDWSAKADAPPRYDPSDWEPRGKRKIFVMDYGARLALFALGQRGVAPSDPRYPAFAALVHILGGSYSSRLMEALRTQGGLTYSVTAQLLPRRDGSTLMVDTALAGDSAQKGTLAVVHELERLQNEPVTEAELARTKAALIGHLLAGYETTQGALGALEQALELGEDPQTSARSYVERIQAVKASDIQQVARDVLDPHKAPIVIVGDIRRGSALGEWSADDDEMF